MDLKGLPQTVQNFIEETIQNRENGKFPDNETWDVYKRQGYIYQRTWGDHKITVCLNNGSTTIDLREYLGKGSVLLSESYEAGKLGSMG